MKNLKKFNDYFLSLNEDLQIINNKVMEIEAFDNEIPRKEAWRLEKFSIKKNLDESELSKLNLLFGNLKQTTKDYVFRLKFGGFGREKITFNGYLNKMIEGDVFFLIYGYITFDMSGSFTNHDEKVGREIILKLESIDDVMEFFKTFESKIRINFPEE